MATPTDTGKTKPMNQRLRNAKNSYQTNTERVLCVCSSGLLRSPTCANALHKHFGLNTRAVGIEKGFALIPIDDVLLEWADSVVVMDEGQAEAVAEMCVKACIQDPQIYNFRIPDNFQWGDSALEGDVVFRWENRHMYEWN